MTNQNWTLKNRLEADRLTNYLRKEQSQRHEREFLELAAQIAKAREFEKEWESEE